MKTYLARTVVSLCSMAIAGCLAVQANAQMLTFEFGGTLTQVTPDNSGLPAIWGSEGDPFGGTLSFDPSWLNSNSNGSGFYSYLYNQSQFPTEQQISLSISTPSDSRQIGPNSGVQNIVVLRINDTPGDCLLNCAGEYGGSWILDFTLSDPVGSGLNGTSVPSNLNLNDWATHYVQMNGPGGMVQGNITSLQLISPQSVTPQFVPEPSVVTMLSLGVIGLLLKWRVGTQRVAALQKIGIGSGRRRRSHHQNRG